MFGIFVVGLVVLIVVNAITSRRSDAIQAPRTNNKRVSLRTAKEHGLDQQQAQRPLTLTWIARVRHRFLAFINQGLLDDVLKRGFHALNDMSLSANGRETLTAVHDQAQAGVRSIRQLDGRLVDGGQAGHRGGRFPTRVLASVRDQLASPVAMDKKDNQIQRKRGTRLKLVFYQESGKGYSFVTKVRGYETVQSRTARLAVFRKVRRVRPHPPRGGKMHLQFTRISLRYPNQVHRYVYEFQTAHPTQRRGVAH